MQKTQTILSIFPKFCLGCSCGVLWAKLDCHYGFLNFEEICTNTSTSLRCTRPAILIWEKSQPKQGRRERRRKFRFCYCKVTQLRNNCAMTKHFAEVIQPKKLIMHTVNQILMQPLKIPYIYKLWPLFITQHLLL